MKSIVYLSKYPMEKGTVPYGTGSDADLVARVNTSRGLEKRVRINSGMSITTTQKP